MPTKLNKTRQTDGKTVNSLSNRQIKALPFVVASATYTEGCKKAKVDRATFYTWLDDQAFRTELERQQKAVSDRALGVMAQNVTAAAEKLASLINDDDKRLARLASKDMLKLHQKYTEIKDLEGRLTALEQRISK